VSVSSGLALIVLIAELFLNVMCFVKPTSGKFRAKEILKYIFICLYLVTLGLILVAPDILAAASANSRETPYTAIGSVCFEILVDVLCVRVYRAYCKKLKEAQFEVKDVPQYPAHPPLGHHIFQV